MDKAIRFLFFVLQYQVVYSSFRSLSANHLCSHDQSLLLLHFKHIFTIDSSASIECDSGNQPSFPKTMSWNKTIDCCEWDGVTCDRFTGDAIGLDLSCSQLQGTIDSNSSLFQLPYLQRINLAYNDFSISLIPRQFGWFRSLTYLNLSGSVFSGPIPLEISHLSKLVSLDLSENSEARFERRIFKILLQNLTQLQELFLTDVQISSVVPLNFSSSLKVLSLSNTGLYGKLPNGIFHLPNLEIVELSSNYDLIGHLPKIKWNSSNYLRNLDLSQTSFSGEIPESIGNLESLKYLDISNCQFSGTIPNSIGNLTLIDQLVVSSNNLSGQLPSTFSLLEQLVRLDLSYNNLKGQIPDFFGNLKKLTDLSMGSNNFNGQLPSSVANLTRLESLDFSHNSLTGRIPLNISGFQNLSLLFLSDNSFNGTIPSWVFTIPSLGYLDLSDNQFTGEIDEFKYRALKFIALNDNKLYGSIPQSISELVNLTSLYLSSNNFSGNLEIGMFSKLKNLRHLDLSGNSLSLSTTNNVNATMPSSVGSLYLSSCEIKELDFLKTSKNLVKLDLSNNKIHGQIPDWAWFNWKDTMTYLNLSNNFLTGIKKLSFEYLSYIDLRSNLLEGPLPVPPATTFVILMSQNHLTGQIPPLICNLTSPSVLDLSHNNLSGVLPQCLGTLGNSLSVLDLQMNHFYGKIPNTFGNCNRLRSLNLHGNQLEGIVPKSLASCKHLEVLDLGSNKIIDTFPHRLAILPELQVLVLNSNKFHGPIHKSSKIKNPFPKLRIIHLSENLFRGLLPAHYFKKFEAMKNVHENMELNYIGELYYQDSVTVVMKGMEIELVRILTIFTTIDLSSNKFEGEIPDIIGDLNSLRVLNLSHNRLRDHIPPALGNLSVLESLDLSSNQLVGEIPAKLTDLTFMAVLNLSYNHLVGRIPKGRQFDTIENDSYIGNLGLCGFPLSKNCGDDKAPQPSPSVLLQQGDESGFFNGFGWKSVVMGYCFGTVFGLIVGYVMFFVGKPMWFTGIVKSHQQRKRRRLKRSDIRGRRIFDF